MHAAIDPLLGKAGRWLAGCLWQGRCMANGCECALLMATHEMWQSLSGWKPAQASKFSAKDLEQRVAALEARFKDLQEKN